MAANTRGKALLPYYLSSEPQIQDGRLCHRQFVYDKSTILGIYLTYLTMTKTEWPPIPGVKHCYRINYRLNPKSKMANFVTDNLSMTNHNTGHLSGLFDHEKKMAANNRGKSLLSYYLSSEPQSKMADFVINNLSNHNTGLLSGLFNHDKKWPPIPGVKHCFHIIYHLNPKSKMADFVIDNLSVTKTTMGICLAYLTMTKTLTTSNW